ncbi:MAG: MoxR family ATPase [Deltaproteobacteria bacterium]|nr:MoxR family ATPase [Deltaproteobacteria bacterium]
MSAQPTTHVSDPPSGSAPATQQEVDSARAPLDALRAAVARVYLGPARTIDLLLVALLGRGHALLEGVPGVAKTTLVKTFATALGCSVRRVQFTPDLLPSDITGTYVLSPREGSFSLRAGPIFANVVLADEINRAPAKTQAALLEAMQERQVTIEGDRFELPQPFIVLATQNPIDLEGTYPLPEAQIDRFLLHVPMGYPSPKEEVEMLKSHGGGAPSVSAQLDPARVVALQSLTTRIHVEDDVLDYVVALTTFTRKHPRVVLGASPRASLSLLTAARGLAVLKGRTFVTPDDVREAAAPALAHRLVLVPELEGDAKARAGVVDEGISRVPYRRG